MATNYILTREHQGKITRRKFIDAILGKCEGMIVSEEDEKKGLTVEDPEASIGVIEGGWSNWFNFIGESQFLYDAEMYGSVNGNEDAIGLVQSVMGVEFVAEDDEGYSYHTFPVDVNEVDPIFEFKGWEIYEFVSGATEAERGVTVTSTRDGVTSFWGHLWAPHAEGMDMMDFLRKEVFPYADHDQDGNPA
jgi:hypothetical protein